MKDFTTDEILAWFIEDVASDYDPEDLPETREEWTCELVTCVNHEFDTFYGIARQFALWARSEGIAEHVHELASLSDLDELEDVLRHTEVRVYPCLYCYKPLIIAEHPHQCWGSASEQGAEYVEFRFNGIEVDGYTHPDCYNAIYRLAARLECVPYVETHP